MWGPRSKQSTLLNRVWRWCRKQTLFDLRAHSNKGYCDIKRCWLTCGHLRTFGQFSQMSKRVYYQNLLTCSIDNGFCEAPPFLFQWSPIYTQSIVLTSTSGLVIVRLSRVAATASVFSCDGWWVYRNSWNLGCFAIYPYEPKRLTTLRNTVPVHIPLCCALQHCGAVRQCQEHE